MAAFALTLTAMMPGHWPLPSDLRSSGASDHDIHTPISPISVQDQQGRRIPPSPSTTQEGISVIESLSRTADSPKGPVVTPNPLMEETMQVSRSLGSGIQTPQSRLMTPYPSSPSLGDELFFDCPSPSQRSMTGHNEESASASYLIFEPVDEERINLEATDWKRYNPPQELLLTQDGTSIDLESIIAPSIERIHARHIEEEERRVAASRVERPLSRAGKSSVKPRSQVSNSISDSCSMLTTLLDLYDWRAGYGSSHTTSKTECNKGDHIPKRLRICLSLTQHGTLSKSKISNAEILRTRCSFQTKG